MGASPYRSAPATGWDDAETDELLDTSGGYSFSRKIDKVVDYMSTAIDESTEPEIVASPAGIYARIARNARRNTWQVVHRYPRFSTNESVAWWLRNPNITNSVRLALVGMPGLDVRREFEQNRTAWESKKLFMSSLTDIVLLPEYQRIIGLGWPAVPLIVDSLRASADHWFWALKAIVGEDHGQGAATLEEAARQWITWFDNQSQDD